VSLLYYWGCARQARTIDAALFIGFFSYAELLFAAALCVFLSNFHYWARGGVDNVQNGVQNNTLLVNYADYYYAMD